MGWTGTGFGVVLMAATLFGGVLTIPACGVKGPDNPSFPLSYEEAETEVAAMEAQRRPSVRPVVVVGGLFDPLELGVKAAGERIRRMLSPETEPLVISIAGTTNMDECRERVISRVLERWPSDDPHATVEVDVVGFSLGGLVARHAALNREPGSGVVRLRIARLFTIGTPHRGSAAAAWPTFDDRVVALRDGSEFLRALDAADRDYPIFAYARLGDALVHPSEAAPPGEAPWWTDSPAFERPHGDAAKDPRILADICRRLRGEQAYAAAPAMGVPGE